MKKTLIALVSLAATGAFAQVTVSGGVRAAIQNSGLANAATVVSGNDVGANYLSFTAAEDLGGGMKITGNYMARTDLMTGENQSGQTAGVIAAGTSLWRDTSLAVSGNFGEVKAGRWGNSGLYSFDAFDATGEVAAYANAGGDRFNNMIQYTTPSIRGFMLQLGATSSGASVAGTEEGSWLYVDYAEGPIAARLLSEKTKATTAAQTSSMGAGVSYDMGAAKLFASYAQVKLTQTSVTQTEGYSAGAKIPFGAMTGKVMFQNQFNDLAGANTGLAAGVDYTLTKTSNLFVDIGKKSVNPNVTWQVGLMKAF